MWPNLKTRCSDGRAGAGVGGRGALRASAARGARAVGGRAVAVRVREARVFGCSETVGTRYNSLLRDASMLKAPALYNRIPFCLVGP
jgi:hypothetical protein